MEECARLASEKRWPSLKYVLEECHLLWLTSSLQLSNLTSINAVHPGALVRGLITASSSSGINVQILGLFSGTIHPLHISPDASKLQIGKKVQARILWDVLEMEPRQFALSTLEHVIRLEPRSLQGSTVSKVASGDENEEPEDGHLSDVERTYPVGTILDDVKVSRVDSDRGLYLDITQSLKGVVHVNTIAFLGGLWTHTMARRYQTSPMNMFPLSPPRLDHTRLTRFTKYESRVIILLMESYSAR